MEIRHSVDVARLQEHVIEAVAARRLGGLHEPVLLLVPTRRLADHLKRRIADAVPACLNAHVLTHRGLALRALSHGFRPAPAVLPGPALLEIVSTLVSVAGGESKHAALARHEGARRQLLAAFRDLRDAGVSPGELRAVPASGALADLYGKYVAALSRLGEQGYTDAAGLVIASLDAVPVFLREKGIERVIHHGAYELVGVHLELLRACERVASVEFVLPGELRGEAFHTSSRFAGSLGDEASVSRLASRPERRAWIERLARLHDPGATWDSPADAPILEVRHAQGAETELRAAGLRALSLHRGFGVPLREIAIVARSLESYAPFLEDVLAELGLPFETSATQPLRRDRGIAEFLLLLSVLGVGARRRSFVELFRATAMSLPVLRRVSARFADSLDRWSRALGLAGGLEVWRRLPSEVEAERDRGAASRTECEAFLAGRSALEATLDELEKRRTRWRGCRSVAEHAAFVRELAAEVLDGERAEPASREALESVLETFEAMEICRLAAGGAPDSLDSVAVQRCLERLVDATRAPIPSSGAGGIRILDLMQARGLVQDVTIWIGFQHEVFPRRARGNPWLDDAARAELARRSGRLLYPKLDSPMEERLLLACTLGATSRMFLLSYQRADADDGKKKARSSALREVARVFLGEPDVRRLVNEVARRVSAHPAERLEAFASDADFGFLSALEAIVGHAVRVRGGGVPGARAFLAGRSRGSTGAGEWMHCLDAVEKLERFDAVPSSFDGITGRAPPEGFRYSPSSLETLGSCPLRFFLRHLLHVRELDREPAAHRLHPARVGNTVHEVLAGVYQHLRDRGAFPIERAGFDDLLDETLAALGARWDEAIRRLLRQDTVGLGGLFEIYASSWRQVLESFVERDLAELRDRSACRPSFEDELQVDLELAPGAVLPLRGRLDRVFRDGDAADAGLMIDDYKTGGKVGDQVKAAEYLKGHRVQLPLYREMLALAEGRSPERIRARLLSLTPALETAELGLEPRQRDGFLETLRVLLDLANAGRFPAYARSPVCSYCAFRRTCRKDHEPTRSRFEADPGLADFRDCKEKSSQNDRTELSGVRLARQSVSGREEARP